MNAPHRWNLAGLIVLLTALAIDQPVVAKIFRLRRARTVAHRTMPAITPIRDLDTDLCSEQSTLTCSLTEDHDINACSAVHFVSAETISAEPVTVETILGDLDADGMISITEASAVLNNEALKDRLFSMPLADQKDYLMTFDSEMRTQIARLAATHGTWKWRFAVRSAENMGLTASEAEAIAVAWSN